MFAFLLPIFSNVFGFIIKNWKFFIIAGMIGMLTYQNFSKPRFLFDIPTIPHLQAQVVADEAMIASLKTDLDIAAKANAGLTTIIINDNSTIQQWKDVSDTLQQQNNALTGTLTQMQKDSKTKVTTILTEETPQTCEASIQFLRDMKQKLVW